eukprot:2612088-Amphidinium_carterae.2
MVAEHTTKTSCTRKGANTRKQDYIQELEKQNITLQTIVRAPDFTGTSSSRDNHYCRNDPYYRHWHLHAVMTYDTQKEDKTTPPTIFEGDNKSDTSAGPTTTCKN